MEAHPGSLISNHNIVKNPPHCLARFHFQDTLISKVNTKSYPLIETTNKCQYAYLLGKKQYPTNTAVTREISVNTPNSTLVQRT